MILLNWLRGIVDLVVMVFHLVYDIMDVFIPVQPTQPYLFLNLVLLILWDDHTEERSTIRELYLSIPNALEYDLLLKDKLALLTEEESKNQALAVPLLYLFKALDG